MFAKYIGPKLPFPQEETTYWVEIVNGGLSGEITAFMSIGRNDTVVVWSEKYENFEAFTLEWETV